MERIFTNSLVPAGVMSGVALGHDMGDDDTYVATVRAMIEDAVDYEESALASDREEAIDYYYGIEPRLVQSNEEYDSTNNNPENADVPNKSTIVSTDVRDTIMKIIPSLMRIFAGSEHAVEFQPTKEGDDDMAKQSTDYIRYKFWDENEGFLTLYTAIKDCLINKIGIVKWWTDNSVDMRQETYQNITMEQIAQILSEDPDNEIIQGGTLAPTGLVDRVTIRFYKSKPSLRVESVPLEEFRVSRNAKSVRTADLVGHEQIIRASDVVELGYDPELIYQFVGATIPYSSDRDRRNPYGDYYNITNDLVRYGEYFVRIDQDGDGINELRRICVIGDDFQIIDDEIANEAKFAVFSPDPTQHALIGDSFAELTMDIQRINTNLLRGASDSLAQSINPKTVINELLANVDDALNEDVGAVIRTRGDVNTTVGVITTPWVGKDAFAMKGEMDLVRQQRTGISDASAGIDPKALQSTSVMGVDMIANGAQERIELIARIIAETGLKDMYRGLLREVVNNQNQPETIKLRGKWVEVNPSTFDPSMRCRVNPALGKGSDMTRLMALKAIKDEQMMIISKYGLNNGIVGVEEFRNVTVDMAEIANIRNITRYFREPTAEMIKAMETAPTEPTPELILAQAEMEKVKSGLVEKNAELDQKERDEQRKDDLARDKMDIEAFVDLVGIMSEFMIAEIPDEATAGAKSLNTPGA